MSNLNIYEQVRSVPSEAKKTIQAGRLKGKTDINPMWRIKALTEQFGPCGIGWKYVITNKRLETGGNNEIAAFVDIDLFIKVDGQWSDAIPGTGGSMFVANESKGLYTSDECFKMALTDAISVSCKALGFGADVYWEADSTKYNKNPQQQSTTTGQTNNNRQNNTTKYTCANENCKKDISKGIHDKSMELYGKALCFNCQNILKKSSERPAS